MTETTLPAHVLAELRAPAVDPSRVANLIRIHLDALLQSRGATAHRFAQVPELIATIRKTLNLRSRSSLYFARPEDPVSLRVEHVLLRAELQFAAHAGGDAQPDDVLCRYRTFVDRHAGVLFDSLFEWMGARIEDDLFLAQLLHFNRFRFEEVRGALARDHDMYESILRAIKDFDLEDRFTRDSLYARLTGTLGQALGFLACLETEGTRASALFSSASDFLRRDLAHVQKSTPFWIQGVNYLSTLEWCRGDLNAAVRWLAEALDLGPRLMPEHVLRLAGADALVSPHHPQYAWVFLNQLRICGLGLARGELSLRGETFNAAIESCLDRGALAYPQSLVLKWLIVIGSLAGCLTDTHLDRSLELLQPKQGQPILELMRAVDLTVLALAWPDVEVRTQLLGEVNRIAGGLANEGHYTDFLRSHPRTMVLRDGEAARCGVYEAAVSLPYYYA